MNCARRAREARAADLLPAGSLRDGRMPVNRVVNVRDGRMPVNRAVNVRDGRMPVNRAVNVRDGRMPVNRVVNVRDGRMLVNRVVNVRDGRMPVNRAVNVRLREKIPRAAVVRSLRKTNNLSLHLPTFPAVCRVAWLAHYRRHRLSVGGQDVHLMG